MYEKSFRYNVDLGLIFSHVTPWPVPRVQQQHSLDGELDLAAPGGWKDSTLWTSRWRSAVRRCFALRLQYLVAKCFF